MIQQTICLHEWEIMQLKRTEYKRQNPIWEITERSQKAQKQKQNKAKKVDHEKQTKKPIE